MVEGNEVLTRDNFTELRNHAARRDAVRFERLKTMIERPDSIHLHGASGPAVNGFGISTSPATASPRVQNQYPGTYNNNIGGAFRLQGHHSQTTYGVLYTSASDVLQISGSSRAHSTILCNSWVTRNDVKVS